ncbi:hypothetical protein SynPROS71_01266 [Synechococcus sp. PROS-7-1]|nr:hypothetical protein SynPROS71_01266 [Synechococcus sp. PROS-7-1]
MEEARKNEGFNLGEAVYISVKMFWDFSESMKCSGLPKPFCMNSKNEDGGWNFSWGLDNPITGESTRSCFYTIYPNGSVKCREYPGDTIFIGGVVDAWNLACVIISDLVQSHDWDKQETADRLCSFMQQLQSDAG